MPLDNSSGEITGNYESWFGVVVQRTGSVLAATQVLRFVLDGTSVVAVTQVRATAGQVPNGSFDTSNATRYYSSMIRSFADRDTERLFGREAVRRFPASLQRVMLRKLVLVDAADALQDLMSPPGNRLEKLRRDRAGQHSIRINDQWRICFRWRDGDAHDVEIVDYH